MKIIKVGYSNSSKPNKPIVWIDAGIHAREWIAPATAMYIINKLVNNEDDNDIVDLLHEFDFHILPSANPDGYEYSRNFDRFWRKTRSRNRNSLLGQVENMFCSAVLKETFKSTFKFPFKAVCSASASILTGRVSNC